MSRTSESQEFLTLTAPEALAQNRVQEVQASIADMGALLGMNVVQVAPVETAVQYGFEPTATEPTNVVDLAAARAAVAQNAINGGDITRPVPGDVNQQGVMYVQKAA
jgi:hypothetical protein